MSDTEMLEQAASRHSTADELDIVVTKARELSSVRERELNHLKSLLSKLESQLDQHRL